VAAMRFNNAFRNRQAHACPRYVARLVSIAHRPKKLVENPLAQLDGYSRSLVFDDQTNH
jgi:hypothetical protein